MSCETVLRVQVIQGRGLAPKDSNGLSDPYVIVRINNRKLNTKTIRKTLNPEDMFPQFVQVVCWDADFISRDFMGQVTIHMKELFDSRTGLPIKYKEGGNRHWHRLQKKTHKDNVTGEIELNFGFLSLGKSDEYWHRMFHSFGGRISPLPEPSDD
ncbi:hypothetical protein L0F63_002814 [Massospora cicadina]|nr:hypothetical protein L0F63_002814 [Massospora cicadina]